MAEEISININAVTHKNCRYKNDNLRNMPEQQNIEYKSVWKDEYLKWICGFANAQGGTLFIGQDDKQINQ